jgi:hypothetical protein
MPKGRAAYGHVRKPKIEIDGIKFASPGEAERYLELCIRVLNGENIEFFLQEKFEIQPKFRKHGVLFRPIAYIADFKVIHGDGHIDIEDVKGWGGYTTDIYKIKRKLFEYRYPDLTLIALKRKGAPKDIERLKNELQELRDNPPQRTKT